MAQAVNSDFMIAATSVAFPPKLFIFIMYKNILWIIVSKNIFFGWKTKSLAVKDASHLALEVTTFLLYDRMLLDQIDPGLGILCRLPGLSG